MSRSALILSLVLGSVVAGPDARPEEPAKSPTPPAPPKLPWAPGVVHRFVWLEGSDKVGETSFRVTETREGGSEAYEIRATRTYDRAPNSTRSSSTTLVRPDGRPVRYEETTDFSATRGLRARQEVRIEVKDGTARTRYVQNGKEEAPAVHEVALPAGTFLYAGQAVEHWAVFASRLPAKTEDLTLDVYYPDFREILKVTFRRSGTEALRIGGKAVETESYRFATPEGRLEGTVWLDEARRMVQIEFPSRSAGRKALRVILAP